MYEYKVITASSRKLEEALNQLAKEGWRLARLLPDQDRGFGVIAVMERQAKE